MEKAQKKIISNEDAFKQIEAERQKLAKEHQEQEIRWEIDLKYFEEQLSQAKTMVNRLKG